MAQAGWCSSELEEDFPGLGLVQLESAVLADAVDRIRDRLEDVAGRIDGRSVATIPLERVPAAYRALARQLGLDPDADGTPLAEVLRDRIRHGTIPSTGVVADAAAIAMLETGVPVYAVGAEDVAGPLGLTLAEEGEVLAGDPLAALPPRAVVVSDLQGPLALALLPPPRVPRPRERVVLFAIRAPGVADLEVEEALWLAAGLLQGSV